MSEAEGGLSGSSTSLFEPNCKQKHKYKYEHKHKNTYKHKYENKQKQKYKYKQKQPEQLRVNLHVKVFSFFQRSEVKAFHINIIYLKYM